MTDYNIARHILEVHREHARGGTGIIKKDTDFSKEELQVLSQLVKLSPLSPWSRGRVCQLNVL